MEHAERKPNRINGYDYSANGAYFVTLCTQDREKILSSIVGDGFAVPKPCGIIAEEIIAQIPVKYPSVNEINPPTPAGISHGASHISRAKGISQIQKDLFR